MGPFNSSVRSRKVTYTNVRVFWLRNMGKTFLKAFLKAFPYIIYIIYICGGAKKIKKTPKEKKQRIEKDGQEREMKK